MWASWTARPGRKEPAKGEPPFLSLGTAVHAGCCREPSQASEHGPVGIRASGTHPARTAPQGADGLPHPAALDGIWPGQLMKTVKDSEAPANLCQAGGHSTLSGSGVPAGWL